MLRGLLVTLSLSMILTIGLRQEARADCPYRTLTPQGQVASATAPEGSVACVAQPTPDCPQCRSGLQHQCLGGEWQPIEGSSCGGGPQVSAPPTPPAGNDLARNPGQRTGGPQQNCIYYDRDGRRMNLSPKDLAWAEDAGLVADKKCY